MRRHENDVVRPLGGYLLDYLVALGNGAAGSVLLGKHHLALLNDCAVVSASRRIHWLGNFRRLPQRIPRLNRLGAEAARLVPIGSRETGA